MKKFFFIDILPNIIYILRIFFVYITLNMKLLPVLLELSNVQFTIIMGFALFFAYTIF